MKNFLYPSFTICNVIFNVLPYLCSIPIEKRRSSDPVAFHFHASVIKKVQGVFHIRRSHNCDKTWGSSCPPQQETLLKTFTKQCWSPVVRVGDYWADSKPEFSAKTMNYIIGHIHKFTGVKCMPHSHATTSRVYSFYMSTTVEIINRSWKDIPICPSVFRSLLQQRLNPLVFSYFQKSTWAAKVSIFAT